MQREPDASDDPAHCIRIYIASRELTSCFAAQSLPSAAIADRDPIGENTRTEPDAGKERPWGARYDDIIIGAGSSGAVLAARLSEDLARSVLLLEAGPAYASIDATPSNLLTVWSGANNPLNGHDWGFSANAGSGRVIPYPRGKVTGGSSAVNGIVALRGTPDDFDEWATLDNPTWSWDNVLPWFTRI